jgi:hypothetical protein
MTQANTANPYWRCEYCGLITHTLVPPTIYPNNPDDIW